MNRINPFIYRNGRKFSASTNESLQQYSIICYRLIDLFLLLSSYEEKSTVETSHDAPYTFLRSVYMPIIPSPIVNLQGTICRRLSM